MAEPPNTTYRSITLTTTTVPSTTPPHTPTNQTTKQRYAESQGVKTFLYGGKRWNRTQARCMFDLAERPMMFFQTQILNLPGPRIDRPTFVDFGFEDG